MSQDAASQQPATSGKSLTPEQQLALRTDRNISVTAGAGSGKTTILVERYLKILLHEQTAIRRVLAITFTDKASAEMTERVSRRINQLLAEDQPPKIYARLLELREQLSSAQISTIHGFCARVLREFAVAAEIDPDFSIIKEFQQTVLLEETTTSVLEALDSDSLDSDYSRDQWKELLRCVPINTIRRLLETGLQQPHEMSLAQAMLNEQSDEEYLSHLNSIFFTELEKWLHPEGFRLQLFPVIGSLATADLNLPGITEKGRQLFKLIDEILELPIADPRDTLVWQKLLDLSELACNSSGEPFKRLSGLGKKSELGDAYDVLFEFSEQISPLARFRKEVFASAPGEVDKLHIQLLRQCMVLCEAVKSAYRLAKEERGLLDFEDLQMLTLKMLSNDEQVRDALRNRYRYIMVDEFQDTNGLQWDIISQMGLHEEELEEKFFVVGDPKQSIYGFRNADVRVFQRVKEDFAGEESEEDYDGNVVLTQSFRFLPTINRFVNHLFRQLLVADEDNSFEVSYDDLYTKRPSADNGFIELAFLSEDEEEAPAEGIVDQESYMARRISELLNSSEEVYQESDDGERLGKIRPGDIAILIPRRTQLLELESRLREYSIPFKTIGGIGFYRRQEIFDVYYLLRFLFNPKDDIALVSLLRSPFGGVSDAGLFWLRQEKGASYWERLKNIENSTHTYSELDLRAMLLFRAQVERWRRRRDRLSLSQLLEGIFDESLYRAAIAAEWNGEQILANLEKIIELSRDYEQSGFIAMADFIESLHRLIHQDPREGEAQIALEDAGTVKIMTIHQAKGLEFPIVFCPYLQQTIRGDISRIRLDPDYGLAMKISNPQADYEDVTPFIFNLLGYRSKQKQLAEKKRLFYVCTTRARDRLYLSGSYKKTTLEKDNCLGWAAEVLNVSPEDAGQEINRDGEVVFHISDGSSQANPPKATAGKISESLSILRTALKTQQTDTPKDLTALAPQSDTPKGETFSATQLLEFHKDEKVYFQRYHKGFFESDYDYIRESKGSSSNLGLLKGKMVHFILEHGPVLDASTADARMEAAFFYYEVFDSAMQQQLREELPKFIIPFSKTPRAAAIFKDGNWKPEVSLTMKLGSDYFTGTLDLIFKNDSGEWEVLDYKTNNIVGSELSTEGMKYDMQIKAYAILLSHMYPGQQTYSITLHFLKPQEDYRRTYSQQDIEQLEASFLQLINAIKSLPPFR
ncbi:MAG: UvrD-helicase domain-containing protein [Calditrichia bacterium]